MSGVLGTAILETLVDLGGLDEGLDAAEGKSNSVFGGMANLAKGALTVGLGVATAALGAFATGITYAIGEAMEAQEVEAQLNAVLESTGGIAGVSADMAMDLAGSLSEVTRFGDEAILSGENMLLTFTNIGADVFPMATEAMLDLSQATGQDLQSSAVQLGKALNDPIAGITALTRVGVTFTDEQKDMITAMVEAGDVAGAQTLILNELAREFGGSATAAGATFAGQMDILKNSLSNVAEGVGMALLPSLTSMATTVSGWLLPLVKQFGAWLEVNLPLAIQTLATYWTTTLQPALITVWTWMTTSLFPTLSTLWTWLQVNVPLAIQTVSAFWTGTLQPAIASVWAWIQDPLLPTLTELWNWLQVNVPIALQTLSDFWTGTLQPAIQTVWAWMEGSLFPLLSDLASIWLTNVSTALGILADFWTGTLQPAIQTVWGWMERSLFPTLSTLWDWLATNVPAALQTLADFWTGTLKPALDIVWGFMKESLIPLLTDLWTLIDTTLGLALTVFAGIWQNVLYPAVSDFWDLIKDTVKPGLDLLESFWTNTLKPAFENTSFLDTLSGAFDTLGGAIKGVRDFIQSVITKLAQLGDNLPDWAIPGSPMPLELAFWGLGEAMDSVAKTAIPDIGEAWKETGILDPIGPLTPGTGKDAPIVDLLGAMVAARDQMNSSGNGTAFGGVIPLNYSGAVSAGSTSKGDNWNFDFRGVSIRDQEQLEKWLDEALRKRGLRADEIRRIR